MPSIDPTTGAYIGDSNGAVPVAFDWANRYTDDADFRTQIAYYGSSPGSPLTTYSDPSKKGTAPNNATAKYNDGRWPDLIEWQDTVVSEVDGAAMF